MTAGREYSDLVARHFDAPINAGTLDVAAENVFTGRAGDREHGTLICFDVRIDVDRVERITFLAYGCPHTIAACSLATERLTGQPAEALTGLDIDGLARELDVPVEKTGRMLLLQDALHQCFRAWDNRRLAGP